MAENYTSYADEYTTGDDVNEYVVEDASSVGRPSRPRAGGSAVSAAGEQLDREVQRAQEQLLILKRQQEQIEKQKRELEELSRQQEELERGKREMIDKLTRAMIPLERLSNESQIRVEQASATMEMFATHLRTLEAVEPNDWEAEELSKELSRGLSIVETARRDFTQARARLLSNLPGGVENGEEVELENDGFAVPSGLNARDFMYWLRSGFAFTLPVLILGVVALLVYCWANFTFRG
jgi:hypothetical protein